MKSTIFTLEQLKQFDGRAGRPAYVAVKGKVYDVSGSDLWVGGDHQGLHIAGHNSTDEIMNAPHDEDVLDNFPVVGELRE